MTPSRLAAFEACRRELVALAYRMLGDLGRAEDMVQEAWLRWERHDEDVDSPKAFLVTVVARLCLNDLDSARARKEESRADRLPEPVDVEGGGLARAERLEQISMAFLVLLQRLAPAERAVLLLHDVFDFDHRAIADLLGGSTASSRKLLERAKKRLADDRRLLTVIPEEHRRLLRAFVGAASTGDVDALASVLAEDAVLVADGGTRGRQVGGLRNLPAPLEGARRIAAFVVAASTRTGSRLRIEEVELNGQPAIAFWNGDEPFAALLVAVVEGKIQRLYFHADTDRLGHLARRSSRRTP
jgi:RNA polymerase sigma-70 factor (ECF subfamily)